MVASGPEQARLLLEEFERRQALQREIAELESRILEEMFGRQVDFYRDPAKRKFVLGSRRAGKTEMWARIATLEALKHPRSLVRIWHSSRLRAKEMLWAAFAYLHGRHGIHVKTNETELTIEFDNGSIIRLVGADKDKEAQKKRGDKTILEIVLEAQNFGALLGKMLDDVIDASLFDLQGTLCVEGTPGPLCSGPWFDISGGDGISKRWYSPHPERSEWSGHRWTLLDNPKLPNAATARSDLEKLKRKRNWADDNPTYLREYRGVWVNDLSALFYKFDAVRNTYDPDVVRPWGRGWSHALGWDLGARDDMALVIWGWHDDYPALYEVFSWKKPGASSQEVLDQITQQEQEKRLNLVLQVADTGGGGKMYVDEVMRRHSRVFTPAKKTEKYEHVRLYNDELVAGTIKLVPGSPLAVELAELMKDPDWPPEDKPDAPPREAPKCPNHCADAGLYSWRGCWHFVKLPDIPRVPSPADGEPWVVNELAKWQKKSQAVDEFEDTYYGHGADE